MGARRGALWAEVVSVFLASLAASLPAKMSDMEDDFMCDDEEDYDLVRPAGGRRRRDGVGPEGLSRVLSRENARSLAAASLLQ